jgi:hypothetical protein
MMPGKTQPTSPFPVHDPPFNTSLKKHLETGDQTPVDFEMPLDTAINKR